MTKDQYLEMMDQMNEEPDWDKCPPDWEDFPELVVTCMNLYHSMGDRIFPDIGFIGKDYTNFKFLLENYGIEEHQKDFVFDSMNCVFTFWDKELKHFCPNTMESLRNDK